MAGDLTTANQTVLWEFLQERIGIPWSTDFIALGRVAEGKLIGVVGYNNFTGPRVTCTWPGTGAGG